MYQRIQRVFLAVPRLGSMRGGYQELNMAQYLKNALFTFENQNCIELYENQKIL